MRVWIDIDNAPHVLIMEPIVRELKRMGHSVFITARDYGNTIDLLKQKKLPYTVIGRHPGKSSLLKVIFLFFRMVGLFFWVMDKKIDVAFAHGSRSQVLPARLLGIPTITMYDYEYISDFIFKLFSTKILLPFVFKHMENRRIKTFPGLKEEIYIWDHKYSDEWRRGIDIDMSKKILMLRPPATMAHYHNREAEDIFLEIISQFVDREDVIIIIVPRTLEQRKELKDKLGDVRNVVILERVVDGISLIKDADVVVSGGGTMNREAALLGKPVYSIFKGKKGLVDSWLEEKGRLRFLEGDNILIDFNWGNSPLKIFPELKHFIINEIINSR